MLYREFGKLDWKVSAVGMGTRALANQWDEQDPVDAWATVRSALEHGITLFDTADAYGIPHGLSEERLGAALGGDRHNITLVSKIGYWGKRTGTMMPKNSVDMLRLCVYGSLYRLRTDWIDVMLCHEGNIEDPDVYLETFELLKQKGEIRAYGVATDSLEVLKRFNVNGTCSAVELDYSLLNRAPEDEMLPYCQEQGIAVLTRGPLHEGLLSGRYYPDTVFTDSVRQKWNEGGAQREAFEHKVAKVEKIRATLGPDEQVVTLALRYVISHASAPAAIPGARSPEQARVNAEAGAKTLSSEKVSVLTAAVA